MKELPILFSTPMVQALLEGRKTMTRRVLNPQPTAEYFAWSNNFPGLQIKVDTKEEAKVILLRSPKTGRANFLNDAHRIYNNKGSKLKKDDLLWVRETWCEPILFDGAEDDYFYKASHGIHNCKHISGKWNPSIFMPKAAARIWLRVTNVKCERLQDISEQDAIKEGIKTGITTEEHSYFIYPPKEKTKGFYCGPCRIDGTYVSKNSAFLSDKPAFHSYMSLWESINGSGSSKKNPWVFVYEFEVVSTKGKP